MSKKSLTLDRLVKVNWGIAPLYEIMFPAGGDGMCKCDITLTNAVTLTNKTMDFNENTFLNFPDVDTAVTLDNTATLTNKTMDYNENTFLNFPSGSGAPLDVVETNVVPIGNSQTTGTPLIGTMNITASSGSFNGLVLTTTFPVGTPIKIYNGSGGSQNIFSPVGHTLVGLGSGATYGLNSGTLKTFERFDATTWLVY